MCAYTSKRSILPGIKLLPQGYQYFGESPDKVVEIQSWYKVIGPCCKPAELKANVFSRDRILDHMIIQMSFVCRSQPPTRPLSASPLGKTDPWNRFFRGGKGQWLQRDKH
jgi:hypothetical protein